MCSVYDNMGTISGTTHLKTIFSFSPATDKHFNGSEPYSSEDSVKQLSHILNFSR